MGPLEPRAQTTFERRTARPCGRRLGAAAVLAAAIVAGAGCGKDRPKTIPVSGRVTYGGGAWPAAGRLYFTPVKAEEGFPSRPGEALFDEQGDFVAQTWEAADGLMPGEYRVRVECWKIAPSMDGPPPVSHVPDQWTNVARSPWIVKISSEERSYTIDYDIPRPSNTP